MEQEERIEKVATSRKALDDAEKNIAIVAAVGTVHQDERSTFSEVATYLHKELDELRKHFQSLIDEPDVDDWSTEYHAFENHFNEFNETLHKELKAAKQTRQK